MKKIYYLEHSCINDVVFTKNSNDFVVSELPLYEFSNCGEHLILHVRKKDLTTWDMLKILSEHSGAKVRDFGYAGLKDKDGMTMQYISIHKKFENFFENFKHDKIKILNKTYHNNKIKIGHLKANRFFIRLKKVNEINASKITHALNKLATDGFGNYFGYQRFGKEQNNAQQGLQILQGTYKTKNKKIKNFLISAYQSELFNNWLSRRIEISKLVENFSVKELKNIFPYDEQVLKSLKAQKQFLKIFDGDIMHHYPHGRAFVCEDVQNEAQRFLDKKVVLTGWLLGEKSIKSSCIPKQIEDEIFNEEYAKGLNGSRRFAWSFLEDVEYTYKEQDAWFEFNFSLQKGSYATTVLDEILKQGE